jgi:hypothetical protein
MALWDKLRVELNRAGEAAQDALDEGKARLEEFRARQRADKAAQALGYAVFHARQAGREIETESYTRLSSELAAAEAEARRYAEEAASSRSSRQPGTGGAAPSSGAPSTGPASSGASGGATADPQPPV